LQPSDPEVYNCSVKLIIGIRFEMFYGHGAELEGSLWGSRIFWPARMLLGFVMLGFSRSIASIVVP